MSFRTKIDMILKAKKLERLSINKIEKLLGVDGTIYKAHKANKYPVDPNLVSELLRKLRIRQGWWDKDWASGSTDIFEKNGTSVQNEPAVNENSNMDVAEAIRVIIGGSEYFVIPKVALEGKYRLMPLEEISLKEKELERRNDDLIRKDTQIQGLYELVKIIASGRTVEIPKIEEGKKNTTV